MNTRQHENHTIALTNVDTTCEEYLYPAKNQHPKEGFKGRVRECGEEHEDTLQYCVHGDFSS